MNQFVIIGKVHSIDENKLLLLVTLSNEGILPLCISQSMLENCKVLKVGDTVGVKVVVSLLVKNFLAFYGAMRLLEDASRPSPPNKNNDGNSALGCGCLVVIVIIILTLCAGS